MTNWFLEQLSRKATDIHQHLPFLNFIVQEFQLKRILELGTREGESTVILLEAASKIGGNVTSIDIDECGYANQNIKKLGFRNWKFIHSDDMLVDWKSPIDLLFVDSSHAYQHTLDEIAKFEPFVVPGGFIVFHDIVKFPSDLDSSPLGPLPNIAVPSEVGRAVSDFLKKTTNYRSYMFYHNNGLGVLRKNS